MTVTVSAPNGATVEFPDGTSYDTVNTVMTQNFHPDASARAAAQAKPAFDPSQPFEAVDKPPFDPSKPFTAAPAPAAGTTLAEFRTQYPQYHDMSDSDLTSALHAKFYSDMPADEFARKIGAPPPAPQGSSAGGVVKSLGTGLAQGVIGLAGIPGDLDNLLAKGNHYRLDNSGFHYGPAPTGETSLPTSDSLQKNVEGVTGDFYKPQDAAEDIANKIGQFAPAMIGGPESLAAKALTRVVAPAVASEAAGKLTEGTAAQPWAEVGGALVGAGGATAAVRKFQEMAAARNAARLVPTSDDIKAASRASYQHPDVAAVQIHADAVSDLADSIYSDLQHGPNSGFRPANEPKVFNAVDELRTAANEGRPAKIADLDNVRQVLNGLAKEKDAIGQPTRQLVAASKAIDHIDDFLPNLRQSDLLAGDAARANGILEDARTNWAAYKKSSQVQNLAGNAELNAASSHSGANIQNATKQAFKPLLKNVAAKVASWTDDEKSALNNIVRGTWTGHAARAVGNVLGGGGGLGMLASGAAGYEAGGVPGALAGALTGRALKMIGNASTRAAVNKLDFLIRTRSPIAVKLAAQNPQLAPSLPAKSIQGLRTLILADPALAQISNGMTNADQQKRSTVSGADTY